MSQIPAAAQSEVILSVHGLKKYFALGRGVSVSGKERNARVVKAVDGVSFDLRYGEVLALVGESGSGKTTIARTLIGLETPTEGEVLFKGQRAGSGQGRRGPDDRSEFPTIPLKELRSRMQMVFQDPYESLNPRATIFEIVSEPLEVHGLAKVPHEREARVAAALEDAGLRPAGDYFLRYPHELSGGQRQRVVIAAAMALDPEVLLADEPVSMLDVSIRAEILNLLRDLQRQRGVSLLLITHDMGTVSYFSDRLAVMYLGRIVESGTTADVLGSPRHPYTQALLSVVPAPNPRERRERIILQGETPNPIDLPPGCRFHPRCPLAFERCREIDPPVVDVGAGHQATCLLMDDTSQRISFD